MRNWFRLATCLLLTACGSSSVPAENTAAGNGGGGPGPVTLPRDCFWALRSDANALNVLYPDRYATYWAAELAIPPGGEIRLEGEYPHARYMSFNLYNPRLEPLDALADVEIAPDAGVSQPFATGADRDSEPRNYTVRIVAGTRPAEPAARAPNTLYSFQALGGVAVPSPVAIVIYRIYVEDAGYDITGGVGLPSVVLRLANGNELRGAEACSALEQVPPVNTTDSLNTLNPPVDVLLGTSSFEHLQWLKFFDLQSAQANRFNATSLGQSFRTVFGNSTENAGGFASNVHNNYIYSSLSQNLGEVVAIHGKAPATPTTHANQPVMQHGDLRYFSFCTNDANSQRYFDCAYDEQIVRDSQQRYILLVSRPADRPHNARPECGVTWLHWGPLPQSLLIYRHMLPESEISFPAAIQYIPGPPGQHEESTMGEFFPYGVHLGRGVFESLGCPVDANQLPRVATQL